jgi:SAM-dependent methyltransferase
MRVHDFLIREKPTRDFPPISPDASLEEALAMMREKGVARLKVTEDGTCLGIVHRIDLAVHRERTRLRKQRRKLKAERRKLGTIAERDDMYKRSDDSETQVHHDDAYYREGLRVVDHIRAAMRTVEKTDLHRILDLPCGHGRILRFLKAAFPDAELTVCDIDRDGVDFCAREFGATPVYSVENPEEIEIEGEFDLIYSGSLLTHVDRDRWAGFLDLFDRLLAPGGILIFTTEARFHAKLEETKPPANLENTETRVKEFRETGFAYRNYLGQEGYGRTLASPAWVCSFLERWPSLELVSLQVKGLDQDVWTCVKPASKRSSSRLASH